MRPPRSSRDKNFTVRWLSVGGEVLYTSAMTEAEAKRLVIRGHWHSSAQPRLEKLAEEVKEKR